MNTFDTFMERNKNFAVQQSSANLLMPSLPAALPRVKALVIGCADMRVDPAHVLGIETGEAVVMRNIGGRIIPGTQEMLGLLGKIAQVEEVKPGGEDGILLIVLHHTDCGITRLAGEVDMLANYFEISKENLAAKAVMDPRVAVSVDVDTLRANKALPGEWLICGLVYDVTTALIEVIVPPTPLRTS